MGWRRAWPALLCWKCCAGNTHAQGLYCPGTDFPAALLWNELSYWWSAPRAILSRRASQISCGSSHLPQSPLTPPAAELKCWSLWGNFCSRQRWGEYSCLLFLQTLSVKTAYEIISPFHIELSGKAIGESHGSCPFQMHTSGHSLMQVSCSNSTNWGNPWPLLPPSGGPADLLIALRWARRASLPRAKHLLGPSGWVRPSAGQTPVWPTTQPHKLLSFPSPAHASTKLGKELLTLALSPKKGNTKSHTGLSRLLWNVVLLRLLSSLSLPG